MGRLEFIEARPVVTLSDLAERIRAEHALCREAMQGGLAHAVAAGRLLLEARAQCPHGAWGAWLREHCELSARSAQGYMRIARSLPEGDPQRVAHLSLRSALHQLAQPQPAPDPETDLWSWAEAQLDGPFSSWDFAENNVMWLTTKLLHHLKAPAAVSVLLTMDRSRRLPTLRLAPGDELVEAIMLLLPLAKGTAAQPAFDAMGMTWGAQLSALIQLKLVAERAIGALLTETDYRQNTTDEQLAHDFTSIRTRLLNHLDEQLEEVVRARATTAPVEAPA
jgi:hypothetical protein